MNATTQSSRWTLDAGHSAVGFSVRHLMITTVRGEFTRFRADVSYDPARPDATRIDAEIEVASIDTRLAKRDEDLRGPLFFASEDHPKITFVSTSARKTGDHALEIVGALTIRGITHDVALAVDAISDVVVDMRGGRRIGATARATIQRSAFGMTWNKILDAGGVVVSDAVALSLELSLVAGE